MVDKIKKVMSEFKHGTLHSGSKRGKKVKNHKQAIAIAMSEQRRYGRGGRKRHGAKRAAHRGG